MADTRKVEVTASIKERLGEVFEEIFAQGRQTGREEGFKAGLAEGARRERERIRAVCGPAPGDAPGGAGAVPTTPVAETAKATGALSKIKKVLATETAKATDQLQKIIAEKARQQLPVSGDPGGERAADRGLSMEDRCKAEWAREPGVRMEFRTLEAYMAFVREREAGTLG